MLVAQDMGDFYRVPSDNRSLNYGRYYTEGTKDLTSVKDYNSHNTTILNQENIIKLLQKLPYFEKF